MNGKEGAELMTLSSYFSMAKGAGPRGGAGLVARVGGA